MQELKHVHQACRVSFQIVKAALEQLRRGFVQCKQSMSLVSGSVYQDEHDAKFVQVRVYSLRPVATPQRARTFS
jgi:hypothetical protein